ncbi:MAG TPA: hypothetical protein VGB22_03355 [candidate division Zixibacteria bacterium]
MSFVIPELSITFRARFHGTQAACEYASLLALLEFVQINPTLFDDRTLEILGDSFTVVNQLNNRMLCRRELEPMRNTAQILRQKVPYTIGWIARSANPASRHPA